MAATAVLVALLASSAWLHGVEAGQHALREEDSVQVTSRQPLVEPLPTLHSHVSRAEYTPPLLAKLYWVTLSLSDVYAVATCRSDEGSSFNFCVSSGVDAAESGDCRTKHARSFFSSRRLVVALKGTELCNRSPLLDTLKLLAFGSQGKGPSDQEKPQELSCFIPISPYRGYNSTVAVSGRAQAQCVVTVEENLSIFRVSACLFGFALITLAPMLSRSLPFRIGLGAIFAMVFALVLAIYYCTKRPRVTLGSSVFLALAAMNQSWWRSFLNAERMQQAAVVYCLVSACGGAAVSYYFDSSFSSSKATSIISTSFQGVGTLLIYSHSQSLVMTGVTILVAFSLQILSIDVVAMTLFGARGERPVDKAGVSRQARKVRTPPSSQRGKEGRKAFSPFKATLSPEKRNKRLSEVMTPIKPKASPSSSSSDTSQVAHCVSQGLLLNEETSRLIKIGKGTYHKLIKEGWEVDKKAGVISPPSKKKKSA